MGSFWKECWPKTCQKCHCFVGHINMWTVAIVCIVPCTFIIFPSWQEQKCKISCAARSEQTILSKHIYMAWHGLTWHAMYMHAIYWYNEKRSLSEWMKMKPNKNLVCLDHIFCAFRDHFVHVIPSWIVF